MAAIALAKLKVNADLGYKIHPFADAFPMMEGAEFDELVEDIRLNGLREAIEYIDEGGEKIIVDGRNRLKACRAAGIEPHFDTYPGAETDADILSFVWSRNLHRRQLTASQRAMIAAEHESFIAAIAKTKAKAKRANLKRGATKTTKSRKATSGPSGTTAEVVAKAAGVGKTTMKDAMAVKRSGDEKLVEAVKSKKTSVKSAAKEVRATKKRATKKRVTKKPAPRKPTKGKKSSVPPHLPHMDSKGTIHPPETKPPGNSGTESVLDDFVSFVRRCREVPGFPAELLRESEQLEKDLRALLQKGAK